MENGKVLFVPCCNHMILSPFPRGERDLIWHVPPSFTCFFLVTYISISKALLCIVVLKLYINAVIVYVLFQKFFLTQSYVLGIYPCSRTSI